MGCTCTTREGYRSIESNFLTPLEKDLRLHMRFSKDIDRILHRNSTNYKMTKAQLQTACKYLGVDFERFQGFFDRFSTGSYYLMKKLNSLGILLGKGTIEDKIVLLFQNYDIDTSGTLSREEIEMMIESLLSVSCIIIPSYALVLNRSNKYLEDYVQRMQPLMRATQRHFIKLILEEKTTINAEEFQMCFQCNLNENLLSSKKLREYTLDLYATVQKPAELILEAMDGSQNSGCSIPSMGAALNTPKEGGKKKKHRKKKKKRKQYENY